MSPMATVYDNAADLPADFLSGCRKMDLPKSVLMCPPDHFAIVDVKNPHMEGNIGAVDKPKSDEQWDMVNAAFVSSGAAVQLIQPLPDCEDMVFCANQTFVGPMPDNTKLCLLSNMKHPSRQREVPAFEKWFAEQGYRIESMTEGVGFEGSGDAIWHPGRRLIWGGYGHRTDAAAYDRVAQLFDAPVLRLKLLSEHFYHLDTCLCAIDERTALVHAAALAPESLELVKAVFADVVEVPDDEALNGMACNACAILGKSVVIQAGNKQTVAALRKRGFDVQEVDTSEFMKSGGSVFCMKMYVF
jgi:N-dimethylarginine dimethylaminohydrolase